MTRRRRRKKKALTARPRPSGGIKVELVLEAVELARGYDGPLRGLPEPRLLIAAYHVSPGGVILVRRALCRVAPGSEFPQRIPIDEELLRQRVHASSAQDRGLLVVLVMALEEDSGDDVADVYADIAEPARWSMWDPRSELPDVRTLSELVALMPTSPPAAEPVALLRDGVPLEPSVTEDDWVGALMIRVPLSPGLIASIGGLTDRETVFPCPSSSNRNS